MASIICEGARWVASGWRGWRAGGCKYVWFGGWLTSKYLRYPLVYTRHSQLTLVLEGVFYELRVGERWFLWPACFAVVVSQSQVGGWVRFSWISGGFEVVFRWVGTNNRVVVSFGLVSVRGFVERHRLVERRSQMENANGGTHKSETLLGNLY